ncbi:MULTISPECIES: hypothetical protein [Vibrio]|uniref:Uncharacterized protein n=1 Tax=Vibrio halioticoli NBRC 102217 TaxID=1219072 RepID=V5F2Z8_9VIBR|nr:MULTISPECIES: hypothetical protein [Vibrio]MPW36555.1 hypothetical protein [Vibrio sp. B1Z05]GAD89524.1 hypothetical protein VHA01S_021_00180 [Vibrio halioticoli NBRC 102217]
MDEIQRFNAGLFEDSELKFIAIDQLIGDDLLEQLHRSANPFSLLRTQPDRTFSSDYLCNLLAMQSPIIAYRFRHHYRYLVGAFTLEKLKTAVAQKHLAPDHKIPVFVLKKKPSERTRLRVIQFELMENLLDKCFVSNTKKIRFLLENWFTKDAGKRSIFQSKEWQALYPNITSIEGLSGYLSLSKKNV